MLILTRSQADTLGYDLAAEVKAYQKALAAHRFTVDVPAPTAPEVAEIIVKHHGGQFRIDPDPEPNTPQRQQVLLLRGVLARMVNDDEYDAFEAALAKLPKAAARLFDQDGQMAVASPHFNTLVREVSKALGDERADQILKPDEV